MFSPPRIPAVLVVFLVVNAASPAPAQCNQPGPDIVISDILDVGNFTPSGNYDALALGTVITNTGSTPVQYSGCPSNAHPAIAGNLYRYSTVNGAARFEQIGQGWLKHVAVVINQSTLCTCMGGGPGLSPGCS